MKLSEHTMTVLKNFASINAGVVLEKGSVQKTMHPEKSVLVEAEIDEVIPERIGIYDLNQFLGNISTLSNPELEFSEKSVSMKDDTFSLFYLSCSPELIVSPPEKGLSLNDPDVEFDLSNSVMSKIIRLASMNNLPHLSFIGQNGELKLQAHEKANPSSNHASAKISDYSGKDFIATFRVETLKIIPDDYVVAIKNDAFAKFTSKTKKVKYYIALMAPTK
jgi:hypothetical protein